MRGVHRRGKKWHAVIWGNGQRLYLGTFETEKAAAKAYNEAAIKYHGSHAVLNKFPITQTRFKV